MDSKVFELRLLVLELPSPLIDPSGDILFSSVAVKQQSFNFKFQLNVKKKPKKINQKKKNAPKLKNFKFSLKTNNKKNHVKMDSDHDDIRFSDDEMPAENIVESNFGAPEFELEPGKRAPARAVPKAERTTTPFMTKYERARILGTRALQISMNAPVLVDIEGETDPLQIAMKELAAKKIPLVVRRYLPDGSYEDWSVEELIID